MLMNQRNSQVAERQREMLVQRVQKNAANLRELKRSMLLNKRNSEVSERQREMLVQRVQKNRALILAMNRTMELYKHQAEQAEHERHLLLSRLQMDTSAAVETAPQPGVFVFSLLESDVKLHDSEAESLADEDQFHADEDSDTAVGVQVEGPSCDFLMGKSGYKAGTNDLCTCRDDGPFASHLVCMKAVSFPGLAPSSVELDLHFAPCTTKPVSFVAKALGHSTTPLEFGTEASISVPIPYASIPMVGGLEVVGKVSVSGAKFSLGLGVNLCAGFSPVKGCSNPVDVIKLDFPFKCKL